MLRHDPPPPDGARMSARQIQIKTQAFIANLPMFREMSAEELDRIAAATLPVHAQKGESIVHCGDPCTGFHAVVYGQVKLGFTSPQGVEKVVEIDLNKAEKSMFDKSVAAVRGLIDVVRKLQRGEKQ